MVSDVTPPTAPAMSVGDVAMSVVATVVMSWCDGFLPPEPVMGPQPAKNRNEAQTSNFFMAPVILSRVERLIPAFAAS